MESLKTLTYYEDLVAQYVGSYGFTTIEAYKKAYGIEVLSELDIKRARNLVKRAHVKAKITEYRTAVEDKAIKIASGKLGFEREDAMMNVQKVLHKCGKAIDSPIIPEEDQKEILRIFTGIESYDDNNNRHKTLKSILITALSVDFVNHKVADVFLKANRQGAELYNLVSNDVGLKADEHIIKLSNQLDSLPIEVLEQLANMNK